MLLTELMEVTALFFINNKVNITLAEQGNVFALMLGDFCET